MSRNTQPAIVDLVKTTATLAASHSRLIVQRPNAGEPDGLSFLVDFGLRGSLVVNGKNFDA